MRVARRQPLLALYTPCYTGAGAPGYNRHMNKLFKNLLCAGSLALAATGAAHAAEPYVNATIGGVISPGVYGRIDIGNAPPPPVVYAQPVIIQRPAVVVQQQPVYLYVPPGHQKKWGKHCRKYNACGQPVYFVNVDSRGKYRHRGDDHRQGRDDDRGHGKGHGKGNKHD